MWAEQIITRKLAVQNAEVELDSIVSNYDCWFLLKRQEVDERLPSNRKGILKMKMSIELL